MLQSYGKKPKQFLPEALEAMQSYLWPGNVRELENVMERLLILHFGDAEWRPDSDEQRHFDWAMRTMAELGVDLGSVADALEQMHARTADAVEAVERGAMHAAEYTRRSRRLRIAAGGLMLLGAAVILTLTFAPYALMKDARRAAAAYIQVPLAQAVVEAAGGGRIHPTLPVPLAKALSMIASFE